MDIIGTAHNASILCIVYEYNITKGLMSDDNEMIRSSEDLTILSYNIVILLCTKFRTIW